MKLSDFGLCKPLDASNMPEMEGMDVTAPITADPGAARRSQAEQLQNWQRNRRKLVSAPALYGIPGVCLKDLSFLCHYVDYVT